MGGEGTWLKPLKPKIFPKRGPPAGICRGLFSPPNPPQQGVSLLARKSLSCENRAGPNFAFLFFGGGGVPASLHGVSLGPIFLFFLFLFFFHFWAKGGQFKIKKGICRSFKFSLRFVLWEPNYWSNPQNCWCWKNEAMRLKRGAPILTRGPRAKDKKWFGLIRSGAVLLVFVPVS